MAFDPNDPEFIRRVSGAGSLLALALLCALAGGFYFVTGSAARDSLPHTPTWPSKLMGYVALGISGLLLLAALLTALKAMA